MSAVVSIDCTAIPDGTYIEGGKVMLRLSLVLRPVPAPTGLGIPVLDWSDKIAEQLFSITIRPSGSAPAQMLARKIRGASVVDSATDDAGVLWKSIWKDPETLNAYLVLMDSGDRTAADVETFSHAGLVDLAEHRTASNIAVALAAMEYRRLANVEKFQKLEQSEKARFSDPNDPAICIRDNQTLLRRDGFSGVPIGEAFDSIRKATVAGSSPRSSQRGFGGAFVDPKAADALQKRFLDSRTSIRGAVARASAADQPGVAAGPAVQSWNPFGEFEKKKTTLGLVISDPMHSDIYGNQFQAPVDTTLTGAAPPTTIPTISPTRIMLDAFDRALATDQDLQVNASVAEDKAALAARYVASLQAHPTLRKFLRLIVDIPLSEDEVRTIVGQNDVKAVIAASVDGAAAAAHKTETAFVLRTSAGQILFEPCPQTEFDSSAKESLVPSLPLTDGVVKLTIGKQGGLDGGRRFRLEVMDAIAATLATRTGVQATEGAVRCGASSEQTPIDEPSLHTRGLTLLDTEAHVTLQVETDRAAAPLSPVSRFYAEDLVDGYRVDLVNSKGERFPAGLRRIKYDPIPASLGIVPYSDVAHRDEGYVKPMSRVWTEEGGQQRAVAGISQSVFCWAGNNIGVPDASQLGPLDDTGCQIHADDAVLPVGMTYSFDDNVQGPILRVGKSYKVLLRARKLNGSSVVNVPSKLIAKYALGGEDGDPYAFVPVERSPAPEVLIPEDELLSAFDPKLETTFTLIVGSDKPLNPTSSRILLSPSIGFNNAELLGEFDEDDIDKGPRMAKLGVYRRVERDKDGHFPSVVPHQTSDGQTTTVGSRFRLTAYPSSKPYYADNTLCALGMSLLPLDATPPSAISTKSPPDVAFWRTKFDPDTLKPIKMQVVAITSGTTGIRAASDTTVHSAGHSMTMPSFTVEVAPADTVELQVWISRDATVTLRRSVVKRALKAFVDFAKKRALNLSDDSLRVGAEDVKLDSAAVQESWNKISRETRISALHEVVKFRIEHRVRKPLEPPEFGLIFGCTRVLDAVDWKNKIDDGHETISSPGGEIMVVYGGNIGFDRKSTGALWAECVWKEGDPKLAMRRTELSESEYAIDQPRLWTYEPFRRTEKLFEVPVVPSDDPAELKQFDLLNREGGGLRVLTGSFKDSKARRVMVRLGARTRFAKAFSGAEVDLSKYSATEATLISALELPDGAPMPDGVKEVWLPATRRPAKPNLNADAGALYLREFLPATGLPPGHKGKTLRFVYRRWFDNDLCNSGEGEKYAIVCRSNDPGNVPDWLEAQLSRWGADMTAKPGAPIARDVFLQPEAIEGARKVSLTMPLPAGFSAPAGSTDSRQVNLAVLTPSFDPGIGKWYCDIAIVPTSAFRVDIKLGLVRYQEHAVPGCNVSEVVLTDAFALYQPWTFSAARNGDSIEVLVSGPSYTERAPMIGGLKGAESVIDLVANRARLPLITVELERLEEDGNGPLPVTAANGRPVMLTSEAVEPAPFDGGGKPGDLRSGWLSWKFLVAVPAEVKSLPLAVRISLSSAHASSEAEVEVSNEGALIQLPEPLMIQLKL